jgi:hypothetical protein
MVSRLRRESSTLSSIRSAFDRELRPNGAFGRAHTEVKSQHTLHIYPAYCLLPTAYPSFPFPLPSSIFSLSLNLNLSLSGQPQHSSPATPQHLYFAATPNSTRRGQYSPGPRQGNFEGTEAKGQRCSLKTPETRLYLTFACISV